MSNYTTLVRNVCESYAGLDMSVGQQSVKWVLEHSAPKIFDFDYPIFDKNYKLPLEMKILRHYYMREIGMETVGLWKLRLEDKMNLIMPYYNQLYMSGLEGRNWFDDTDYTIKRDDKRDESSEKKGKYQGKGDKVVVEDEKGNVHDISHDTTNTTSDGTKNEVDWSLYQDTPQNGLKGVEDMEYLTNANKDTKDVKTHDETASVSDGTDDVTSKRDKETNTDYTDNKETEDNAKILTVDDYLEHVFGKRSYTSYAELLLIYRQTFLNIDQMIVDECSDLFFGLWS